MRVQDRLIQLIAGCFCAAVLAGSALCQSGAERHKGVPDDWSHHRLVFSNPGTFQDAMRKGSYDRWYKIVTDPRFRQQQLKRHASQWQATALSPGGSRGDGRGEPSRASGVLRPPNVGVFQNPPPPPLHVDWSMNLGSTGSVGAGQYPAKFSIDTGQASCDSATQPDFVVYNTNLAGSGSQPSIIAYDNLYSSCSGVSPLAYFQYNTDGGVVPTSIVLSDDGIQMAFVQNNGGVASLVILKSLRNTPGDNASVITLSNTDPSLYRACTAPCMTELPLQGGASVTFASPFYDYANDVLYLGDDIGQLHKFQNIFVSGMPSELSGGDNNSGWPQNISEAIPGGGANALTSAVYDSVTGNIFVAIVATYNANGGYTAYIPSTGGSDNIIYSSQLANSSGYGLVDSPLVDSSAATVYDFADIDNTASFDSGVFQQTTTFPLLDFGVEQQFGPGNIFVPQVAYDGAFDNMYYSSPDPSNPSGNIYAWGRDPSGLYLPTLYQVPIANNVMQAPVQGPVLTVDTGNPADGSPVREFFDAPDDWIFLSVTNNNSTDTPILCPSGAGCFMSFDVTFPDNFSPSTGTYATTAAAAGTSGIIVDSDAGPLGSFQIYFSTLGDQACSGNGTTGDGTGGCAIQATQKSFSWTH